MAALMGYVRLEHEEFSKLHKAHGSGGSGDSSSLKSSNQQASSSNASPEASNNSKQSSIKSSPSTADMKQASIKSPSTSAESKLLHRLEAYRNAYLQLTPPNNFDTAMYKAVEIVSGTTDPKGRSGTASFRIKFTPEYCNKFGTVHGGAIATLLDGLAQCSTAVVDGDNNEVSMASSRKGQVRGGATRGLQVGYLKSIQVGEPVVIVCEILKSSWSSLTIRETLTRESDGEVLAVCSMEKEKHDRASLSKL